MNDEYAVLGTHGEDVKTVDGNVVRIRMFVDGQMIDEDFSLPRLITIEEQIETAARARIAEIRANGVQAVSNVVPEQTEQIIVEAPNE